MGLSNKTESFRGECVSCSAPRHTTMNENRVGESIKRTNLLLVDERLYDDGNFVRSELRSSERASVTNTRMDICNRNPSAIKSCVITCALDCLHLKLLITVSAHTRTHAGSAEARGYRQKKFPMFTLHFRLIRNASVYGPRRVNTFSPATERLRTAATECTAELTRTERGS